MCETAHCKCCGTHQLAARPGKLLLTAQALLATPLFEGVMRHEFAASAVVASATDSSTLKRAIGHFLALCKAERLPPADILVQFDAFLASYNARQKRLLLSSMQEDNPSLRRLGPGRLHRKDSVREGKRAPRSD